MSLDWSHSSMPQMRSAFWRGVALLKESDLSNPDVDQYQGEPVTSADLSTNAKGFSELLKNVMLLEAAISRLMDKVSQEQPNLICLS
jgi:hypothetical protein